MYAGAVGVSQGCRADAGGGHAPLPGAGALLAAQVRRAPPGLLRRALRDWQACPIGRKRPHKSDLFAIYDAYRRGESVRTADPAPGTDEPLDATDYQLIELEEIPGREKLM